MIAHRNTGNLTALHILRVVVGLQATTSNCKLDAEEKRRLVRFFEAGERLGKEQGLAAMDTEPEARVRVVDERVDRKWFVVRDVLASLGRLAGELPLGAEAERLSRKLLPEGVAFTRLDGNAQLAHGQRLHAAFMAEKLSPAMKQVLGPILAALGADHEAYASALLRSLTTRKRTSELGVARREALDALDALVALVCVMATTPEAVARAEAILVPVDAILEIERQQRASGGDADPDVADTQPIPLGATGS